MRTRSVVFVSFEGARFERDVWGSGLTSNSIFTDTNSKTAL